MIEGPAGAIVEEQLMFTVTIEPRHTAALVAMPLHHRDPFDRLLIAQALVEGMPLVSVEGAFYPYGVTRLW